ncbi:MAG: hypothetical protein BroJett011_70780 [Chloroflexota bacterium]|nr:MAG: hypothetical protein BroJett011_70780 [Chloroflexota bacterium]
MTQALDLKITPFQLSDGPQLIEVINSVCTDTPWMQTRRFEPTPAWQHALENEVCSDHLLALVKVKGRVTGWCRLFPVESQRGGVELGIGVLRSYRRQGVGRALMGYVMEWGRSRGVAEMVLTTHRENRPAVRLFERYGFVEEIRINSHLQMSLEV